MLEFSHIDKSFHPDPVNTHQVFQDFSLTLPDGQFLSIVGSNGSGKTTLLNLLCGSLQPDAGSIRLDGEDLLPLPEHRRYERIGRVFQDPALGTSPRLTILENLSLAENKGKAWNLTQGVRKDRIEAYQDRLAAFGLGLEKQLNTPVAALSGGQRQAVALLMATLPPIDYLVLDEHTAALDSKTANIIMKYTEAIVREKGLTALMVTHNLRYALSYGDRLIMMHEGKIVEDRAGAAKEAMTLDQLLQAFDQISIERGNAI